MVKGWRILKLRFRTQEPIKGQFVVMACYHWSISGLEEDCSRLLGVIGCRSTEAPCRGMMASDINLNLWIRQSEKHPWRYDTQCKKGVYEVASAQRIMMSC